MIKQLSKKNYEDNLLNTISEIIVQKDLCIENKKIKFVFEVDHEPNKNHNSGDEIFDLWLLSDSNLKNKEFDLIDVINILSYPSNIKFPSKFPLWVNVSFIEEINDILFFQIETSTRFRSPSILKNQETNHPPFKAVLD